MNAIVVKTQVPENLRRLLRALGDTAAKHANPEAQGREDFDRAFVRNIFVRDLIEARLTNKLDATDEQRADLGYISTLVDRAFSPAPEHEQPFESPNQNLAQIHAHVKYAVQGWRDFASEWIDSLSGRKAWQQRR